MRSTQLSCIMRQGMEITHENADLGSLTSCMTTLLDCRAFIGLNGVVQHVSADAAALWLGLHGSCYVDAI